MLKVNLNRYKKFFSEINSIINEYLSLKQELEKIKELCKTTSGIEWENQIDKMRSLDQQIQELEPLIKLMRESHVAAFIPNL